MENTAYAPSGKQTFGIGSAVMGGIEAWTSSDATCDELPVTLSGPNRPEVAIAELAVPAGAKAIISEGLLMKQQLLQCGQEGKVCSHGRVLDGGIGGSGIDSADWLLACGAAVI